MMIQEELIRSLISRTDPATGAIYHAPGNECTTTLMKQKEVAESEMVGSYWSGQPGKDLFFNNWKLLF